MLYTGTEPLSVDFNEVAYLFANVDVEAAVRSGELDSGFEHWRSIGQKEGRPLRPVDAEKLERVLRIGG